MKTKLNKKALIDLAQAYFNYPDLPNSFNHLPWTPAEEKITTDFWDELYEVDPDVLGLTYNQKCRDVASVIYSYAAVL